MGARVGATLTFLGMFAFTHQTLADPHLSPKKSQRHLKRNELGEPFFVPVEKMFPDNNIALPIDYDEISKNSWGMLQLFSSKSDQEKLRTLFNDYSRLVRNSSASLADREAWSDRFFTFVGESLETRFQHEAIKYAGFAAFSLFPELSYSDGLKKMSSLMAKHGVSQQIETLAASVDFPEACPSFSLLNNPEAAKRLRAAEQVGGTCYAHGAIKALDYLNWSTGFSPELTSIVSAALGARQNRAGDAIDIDSGREEEIDAFEKFWKVVDEQKDSGITLSVTKPITRRCHYDRETTVFDGSTGFRDDARISPAAG